MKMVSLTFVLNFLSNSRFNCFLGLTAEEAEAAAKKIGWVDEKEAEQRIGTGWWQEQQEAKSKSSEKSKSTNKRPSLSDRAGSSSQSIELEPGKPN